VTGVGRAFVAVDLPPAVGDAITGRVDACRALGRDLRWARAADRHLTLHFLGAIADVDAVAAAVADAVAPLAPSAVTLGGAGAFPTARRGTVVWVGVVEGAAWLGTLATVLREALVGLVPARPDHAFRAHVTVARSRRPRDVRRVVDALGDGPVGPSWTVRDVALFASETRPEGAHHSELARCRLGRARGGR
jgi:RNA 2',3'-cyclic 3'-phosphodiesterase